MRHVAKRQIGMLDLVSPIEIESSEDAIRSESRAHNPPEGQIFTCSPRFSAAC